jgi:hypothetical protein
MAHALFSPCTPQCSLGVVVVVVVEAFASLLTLVVSTSYAAHSRTLLRTPSCHSPLYRRRGGVGPHVHMPLTALFG